MIIHEPNIDRISLSFYSTHALFLPPFYTLAIWDDILSFSPQQWGFEEKHGLSPARRKSIFNTNNKAVKIYLHFINLKE